MKGWREKNDSSRDKREDIEVCGTITKGGGSIIRKVMDHTFDNWLKNWGWRLKVSHYSPCEQNTTTRECGDDVTSKPFCSKTHWRVLFTYSGEYVDYIWRTTNQRYFPFLVVHQNRWFTWSGLKDNVSRPSVLAQQRDYITCGRENHF